jgi:hypothetical protein
MKTTVSISKELIEGLRAIYIDERIYKLRTKLWATIFKEKGSLSDCDIAMALGIVQYELIHHTSEV